MTDPDKADELLSKADALLGRYRHTPIIPQMHGAVHLADNAPAGATAMANADFPLLTEVVELPNAPAAAEATHLREKILATLTPELEKRLSDTLKPRVAELLDVAMQTVQIELEHRIRAAVRGAVAEAIDEALEKQRRDTSAGKP